MNSSVLRQSGLSERLGIGASRSGGAASGANEATNPLDAAVGESNDTADGADGLDMDAFALGESVLCGATQINVEMLGVLAQASGLPDCISSLLTKAWVSEPDDWAALAPPATPAECALTWASPSASVGPRTPANLTEDNKKVYQVLLQVAEATKEGKPGQILVGMLEMLEQGVHDGVWLLGFAGSFAESSRAHVDLTARAARLEKVLRNLSPPSALVADVKNTAARVLLKKF